MHTINLIYSSISDISRIVPAVLILLVCSGFSPEPSDIPAGWKSCGITDIDETRLEVMEGTTTTENAIPRRATLYRWWRFLMHQGYDMSPFDETAEILLKETYDLWLDQEFSTPLARQAISDGFAVLEEIYAGGVYIQEVQGKPDPGLDAANDRPSTVNGRSPTDWPFYHGVSGAQTGHSPDPGPSTGKIAWRFPKGAKWTAKPVLENGRVYLSSPGVDVIAYCLDENSGEVIWKGRQYRTHVYFYRGSRVDPVLSSEGMLVRTGRDAFLFDKDDGELLGRRPYIESNAGLNPGVFFVYASGKKAITLADAVTGYAVWQKELGNWPAGEPILVDQRVYAATSGGKIFALDAKDGDIRWTSESGLALDGPLSMGSGRLYAGSRDARLICLDPEDGSIKWTFQSPDKETRAKQYFSAVTEANGKVYVGSAGKHLYCLDANTGKLAWKYRVTDWIRSRPVVEGERVCAATLDGKLFSLDVQRGKQQWVRDLNVHGVVADLVSNNKGILACGRDGILFSVLPESGEIRWKHGIIDGAFLDGNYVTADWGSGGLLPTPSVVDGVVYIGGPDGFVNAVDVRTGKELWRFETKSTTSAALTVSAGKVFFGSLGPQPEYYALDMKTGEVVWESSAFSRVWVGASHMDDRLVFGTMDGIMHGLDANTGKQIWQYNIEQDIAEEDWTTPGVGIYPNPAFDSEFVYMGSWIGYYMAFDPFTGKMKWKCRTFDHRKRDGRPDSAAPVLWKGHLYVQKLAEYIAAINISSGEIEWQWKAPYGMVQNGTVAAFNDKIFGSAYRPAVILPYNCRIYVFNDVENGGDLLWEYEGGGGWTAPVGTDDKLIFGSSGDAHMTCLNPENGSLKWRVYTGDIMRENVPAIYGNKVIAHFMNGWLLAIE